MHHFSKKIISDYEIKQLYELVSDINQYPKFIPWCDNLRILKQEKNSIEAEVVIKALGIREKYISNITLFPIKKGKAAVLITSNSSPFKQMESQWLLTKADNHKTEVHFSITFALKSRISELAISQMSPLACEKIINAFQARANELFNNTLIK
ncbi:MAG: Ribosome association toxin PasT (RatA) of the RatAB toxin-antitoxin module [Candidatus Midichloria mitochondrii]|uniref:Cyclase/dehydrase n=1 Tax=Midichloria mitochondrii (strain IricVA) TaxID=696127 RepID=F7XTW0_MIDMI|nr:type II toxin-antitoxin system RatA family toxin [Candidatus Midichloria mitochondrii]AEI89319.1 cyclase/dehydrase [Candidatus Midichloria mitochondrii IricVA]MDJ1256498.1 type II toxin-antitoxin system RatA family toxin [Candidatus Midichloria mitochondrii]MDJ1288213.1 type II toxin-antitoxin system RatA family toxin [Candidatus Midichloria mitochondrii]MDJ1299033.1 type II toxin-antitoxin system RatA family toxin [Candidatus Midichloria mitochondrii]MDJ1313238.1 type II toxin-antitoxin sy